MLRESFLVKELFIAFVLWVVLNVGLEVISVLLLLLSESAEEVSVVFGPSLLLGIKHTTFTTFEIVGVAQFTCIELLDLVEDSVEFGNGKLNVVPGLVLISTEWNRESLPIFRQLAVNLTVGLVHRVELFVSFFQFLELISRIDKDAVGFI